MVWCFSQFGCAAGVHIFTVVVWDIVLVCTFWPRNKGCKIGRNFCYIVVHLIRSKNILKDHSSSNSRDPLGWKRGRKRFLGRLDHLSGHISCSNLIWNRLWNFASGRLKWLREKSYLLVWKKGRVSPEAFMQIPSWIFQKSPFGQNINTKRIINYELVLKTEIRPNFLVDAAKLLTKTVYKLSSSSIGNEKQKRNENVNTAFFCSYFQSSKMCKHLYITLPVGFVHIHFRGFRNVSIVIHSKQNM